MTIIPFPKNRVRPRLEDTKKQAGHVLPIGAILKGGFERDSKSEKRIRVEFKDGSHIHARLYGFRRLPYGGYSMKCDVETSRNRKRIFETFKISADCSGYDNSYGGDLWTKFKFVRNKKDSGMKLFILPDDTGFTFPSQMKQSIKRKDCLKPSKITHEFR